MIKEALYRMATKADKEAREDDKYYCTFCFFSLIKKGIRESSYLQDFLKWQEKNNINTSCGSILFYLQDLGVIKILSGAYDRFGGVRCTIQKYTIIKKNIQGNKI